MEYTPDSQIIFSDVKLPPNTSLAGIAQYIYDTDSSTSNRQWLRIFGKELIRPTKKHQFITVALPTEKTDLEQLKKTISKLNYEYLENSYLTVEFYSGLKKENLHIHILKLGIYNKTKLIRDLSRKFKVSDNFVNVKKGTTESDWNNRMNYLLGEKTDELKKENCILDQKWRQDNGFEQIYYL